MYEDHCSRNKFYKDDPILFYQDTVKQIRNDPSAKLNKMQEYFSTRVDILTEIMNKWVPDNIMSSVRSFFRPGSAHLAN